MIRAEDRGGARVLVLDRAEKAIFDIAERRIRQGFVGIREIVKESFRTIDQTALFPAGRATHAPRILLLYGSLRQRSFSRLLAEEAGRLLHRVAGVARRDATVGAEWGLEIS